MIPLFISTPELLFVLFVAVLLFGTDKIPEIARTLGKGMRQLRDATSEIKNEINKSVDKAGIDTSLIDEVKEEVEKAKEGLEDPFGSIKRSREFVTTMHKGFKEIPFLISKTKNIWPKQAKKPL